MTTMSPDAKLRDAPIAARVHEVMTGRLPDLTDTAGTARQSCPKTPIHPQAGAASFSRRATIRCFIHGGCQ